MFIIVILLYVIVITFETISIKNEKNMGKLSLYLTLSVFAMIISVLITLGIELPSPATPIKNIVIVLFGKGN